MNGRITKLLCNLGEIHVSCTDQLFGSVDLECREIFNNAEVALLLENLLKLRTTNQIIPADLFDADMFVYMISQISAYPVENFNISFIFRSFEWFGFQ